MTASAVAKPIDADAVKIEMTELKVVKAVDTNVSESQKFFSVADGVSFEDQAGFFGRW